MLKNLKSFNPAEIEEKVLKFWQENQIFEKSLDNRKNKKKFIFYEGPPTANGRPGLHHVLARSFKDIVPRYKTMAGFFVSRRGGWDTHGLPVEIEVEKALGLKSKKEIEKFGIANFNQKCKESVWRYKDEWEKLTSRIGFWLDLKKPYITYENSYIETLWWILKQVWQKKLLYKGYRVVPWCTRCETVLSSHELAQGYKEVSESSIYVKFKLKKGQKIDSKFKTDNKTYILSWTTTPWTLPGNVALAINPDVDYVNIEINKEYFILAKERILVINEPYKIIHEFKGKELVGFSYEPLFKVKKLQSKNSYKIYPADFVNIDEGTGVVHTAVMYGEDDYTLGKKVGLPQYHTVNEQGKFTKDVIGFNGLYVKAKETEEKILNYLENKNLKFRIEQYTHEYPFCWRCGTQLLYYARDSWFIAMSKLRKALLIANQKINWIPSYIKEGRFGEWLKENKDWAISRERYWGTPLPIWQCKKCFNVHLVESIAELEALQKKNNNSYILARHAEAENNFKNIVSSWPEKEKYHLTLRGRKQGEDLAKKLKKEKIDFIFSSDMTRTKETAEIVKKALNIKRVFYDKRIREINTGDFNGGHTSNYHKYFVSDIEKFTKQPPNGETLTELRLRLFQFVQDIEHKYKNKKILVISHEYPLWMLESLMLGWTDEDSVREKNKKKEDFIEKGKERRVEFRLVPRDKTGQMDFHRPYIDQIIFTCKKCGDKMKRITEVADVWFDSGAMPFASVHYPFDLVSKQNTKGESRKLGIDFPADYICEGIDQTRGWFYTLLAISVLLNQGEPYKNVISLGLLLDKYGQKMSKSKGNIVDPWQMAQKYGADAIRWYFYTINSPGEPKYFDETNLAKTLRQFILLIYNSFIFFETYSDKQISKTKTSNQKNNILDRWIISRLNEVILKSTEYLDRYEIGEAAKSIEEFVSDFSRWYIRRSRRRFQKPNDNRKDYKKASQTLEYALFTLSKLLAPFVPFFAEALYQSLNKGLKISSKKSVHLEDWPKSNKKLIDKKILAENAEVRRLATLVLAKRAEFGIKVRQPLASLKIKNQKSTHSVKASTELSRMSSGLILSETEVSKIRNNKELLGILAEEVNVKEIIFDNKIKDEIELDTKITPELREEGIIREFIRIIQDLRQKASYEPKDRIFLYIKLSAELEKILNRHLTELKKEVGAKDIKFKGVADASGVPASREAGLAIDAELNTQLNFQKIWLGIKKI